MGYHEHRRGGRIVDFKDVTQHYAARVPFAHWSLVMHFTLMSLACGAILPLGVTLARAIRHVPGASGASWLRVHRRFQTVGWAIMMLGVGAIVWHVQDRRSLHFSGFHPIAGTVIVVLVTLQPIMAVLRPPADARTTGRLIFECLHKNNGRIAIALGLVNLVTGVFFLQSHVHNASTLVVACSVSLVCVSTMLALSLVVKFRPRFLSRFTPNVFKQETAGEESSESESVSS